MREARNDYIDLLRGLSILAVVFMHALYFGPIDPILVPQGVLQQVLENGYYGVSAFFTISGFLITSMAMRRYNGLANFQIKHFYVFRFSRIMPGLVLVVAVVLLLGWLAPTGFAIDYAKHPIDQILLYIFTFRFNHYPNGTVLMSTDIFWSLSVEEMFYLLFPILCLTLRRLWLIVAGLMFLVIMGPAYRSLGEGLFGVIDFRGTFDQLAIGCLAAIAACRFPPRATIAGLCRIAGLAGVIAVYSFVIVRLNHVAGPTLICLAAGVFLFGCSSPEGTPRMGWVSLPLRSLGRLSYEAYLLHPLIILAIAYHFPFRWQWGVPADIYLAMLAAITLAVSWPVARYILEPTRRWVRRTLLAGKDAALPLRHNLRDA
jgi:peptidoglycan/LPS O-acetylase OafA/YrhL